MGRLMVQHRNIEVYCGRPLDFALYLFTFNSLGPKHLAKKARFFGFSRVERHGSRFGTTMANYGQAKLREDLRLLTMVSQGLASKTISKNHRKTGKKTFPQP
jgi:hypothetical protein